MVHNEILALKPKFKLSWDGMRMRMNENENELVMTT
jgi:hypothetical protein